MPLHVSSTSTHRQKAKIVLYSLWYHHAYRCTKFYNEFISCLYMFRAQVLIVRRPKLFYTVSGIITPIGALNFIMSLFHASTCFEHVLIVRRAKIVLYSLWYHHTYRCDDTRDCIVQFWPPDDEHLCSKHAEAWNKLIIKFSASSWLILR